MLPVSQHPPKRKQLNKVTGKIGEVFASEYLLAKGYKILDHNFSIRSGEIDIIARHPSGKISFIEVKCRIGVKHGMPYESVTISKLKRLSKTIQFYLLKNNLKESKLAMEVISIVLNNDQTINKLHHFDDVAIGL